MVPISYVVDEQTERPGSVGDEHVDVAVVIDVAERRAAAHLGQREYRSGPVGHILEPAVAPVAEHLIALVQREGIVRTERLDVRRHRAVDSDDVQPPVALSMSIQAAPKPV